MSNNCRVVWTLIVLSSLSLSGAFPVEASARFIMSGSTGSAHFDHELQDAIQQAVSVPLSWFSGQQTDNGEALRVEITGIQMDAMTFTGKLLLTFQISCTLADKTISWDFSVLADPNDPKPAVVAAVGELLQNELHALFPSSAQAVLSLTGEPILSCFMPPGFASTGGRLGLMDGSGRILGAAEVVSSIEPRPEDVNSKIHAELVLLWSLLDPVVGIPLESTSSLGDATISLVLSPDYAGLETKLLLPTSLSGFRFIVSVQVLGSIPTSSGVVAISAGIGSELPFSTLEIGNPLFRNSALLVTVAAGAGVGLDSSQLLFPTYGGTLEVSLIHRWAPGTGLGLGCGYGHWVRHVEAGMDFAMPPNGLTGRLFLVLSL